MFIAGKMFSILHSLLIIVLFINHSDSAKILGAVFTPSYSHQIAFQPIWKELSLRGHTVTVLTTNPMNDPSLTNLTEIDLSVSYEVMKTFNTDELLSSTKDSAIERISSYLAALNATADTQFSIPEVQALIHDQTAHFDLLIVEVIYPTHMALAWRFQVPFIGLVSLDALPRLHEAIGNPVHPVLYPDVNLPFDTNLSFSERFISILSHLFMKWYEEYKLYPGQDLTVKKYFGENAPTLKEIQNNMSMLFINANPVFQNVRPLGPATVQIGGGIHLKKTESLPQEIKQFLDGAKDGFIYFSLGSNVKSSVLDANTKATILKTISSLPYKVLWKFEDNFENLPSNVKIVNWAPQTAILAHPNIKAFITQCGLQSMEEAIFYRVPMIGLPFYGDQLTNSKILQSKGLGLKLSPKGLSEETFQQAIMEVATNPSFRNNLEEISDLMQDQMTTGLDKAIWWTEYVLRHKGARHLRCPIIDLPLYQYYMLDIITVLVAALILIIYILKKIAQSGFKLIHFIIRGFKKSKKE